MRIALYPYQRLISRCFSLLIVLLLVACQTTVSTPTETKTLGTEGTSLPSLTPLPLLTALPSPSSALPDAVAATPTNVPLPTPTATIPAYLDVDLSDLRGQVVEFWHPWQGDLAARAGEMVQAFNRENEWGLRAQVRSLYGAAALADQVEMVKPGEEAGSVLAAALPEQLADWLAEGRAVDLNEYMIAERWGLSAREVSDFTRLFWEQDIDADGRRSGIPALRTARVLFYNESWAGELGFNQAPATPAEFRAQACAATAANAQAKAEEMRGTGGWLVATDALTTLSWLAAFGADPMPTSEGQPYQFKTKQAEQALTFLREMFDQGCIWEGRNPEPQSYFARRMALFYAGSLQDLRMQARAQEQANSGDRWKILPFPASQGKPLALTTGFSYGILTGDYRQQMGAWLLLRWMIQPRNQTLVAEAAPSFPVSATSEQELAGDQQNFPWFMVLPLQESLRPGPGLASWRVVRNVVDDAGWQVFRLPAEQMKYVLPQMDALSKELLSPR